MRRLLDTSSLALALLAAAAVLLSVVPTASADRRPTKRERSAIKRGIHGLVDDSGVTVRCG